MANFLYRPYPKVTASPSFVFCHFLIAFYLPPSLLAIFTCICRSLLDIHSKIQPCKKSVFFTKIWDVWQVPTSLCSMYASIMGMPNAWVYQLVISVFFSVYRCDDEYLRLMLKAKFTKAWTFWSEYWFHTFTCLIIEFSYNATYVLLLIQMKL